MSTLRILAHLFLVLALLAGGVAPGAAAADVGGDESAAMAPCHETTEAAAAPAPVNCCEDGGCTCDCFHHTPAVVVALPWLPRLAVRGVNQPAFDAALHVAASAPEIRPPIA